jgi:hypothetical protein
MSQTPPQSQKSASGRNVRVVFAVVALVSVLAGLLIYVFAVPLGFDEDLAEIIAIIFLLSAICDYAVLYFWDRIFKNRSR